METILIAVAVGSLLVALVMSAAAWRLSRAERARASARVAALAVAAARVESTPELKPAAPAPKATPVESSAVTSFPLVAPVDTPVVTAVASPARIATFQPARPALAPTSIRESELELNSFEEELPLRPTARVPAGNVPTATAPVTESFLGIATREPSSGGQRKLAVAAAIFCVVLGAGAYLLLTGGQSTTTSERVAAPTAAPLELISLRHERQGGRLTLSGLVRNPSAGAAIDNLTAVVFLFDGQGGFVSSARAGVDFKRLAAGDESPFVVTVDAPANVARYRVSFRTDGGVIAHVDRRAEQPIATVIASGVK